MCFLSSKGTPHLEILTCFKTLGLPGSSRLLFAVKDWRALAGMLGSECISYLTPRSLEYAPSQRQPDCSLHGKCMLVKGMQLGVPEKWALQGCIHYYAKGASRWALCRDLD
jgi:hypothetical protein